jgi:hypothetical protein
MLMQGCNLLIEAVLLLMSLLIESRSVENSLRPLGELVNQVHWASNGFLISQYGGRWALQVCHVGYPLRTGS